MNKNGMYGIFCHVVFTAKQMHCMKSIPIFKRMEKPVLQKFSAFL